MTSDIRRFRLSRQLLKTCANISLTLTLLAGLSEITLAQAAARPDRGIGPGSSYAVSDIENINLTNGNVNLSIPLASLPPVAGGRLGLVVRAEYDSKLWDRAGLEAEAALGGRYTRNVIQLGDGGWGVSGGSYYISAHQLQEDYTPIPPASSLDPEYPFTNYRWKMMLTTPDGARHELRPLDYLSYPGNADYRRGYYKDTPSADSVNSTMRYYSFDGSYLWAKIDPYPAFGFPTSWTVYLPDGTTVEQSNGIQRIKDPNGNKIKIFTDTAGTVSTTHYQDELTGREIKVTFDIATYTGQVQYQVVGGAWAAVDIVYGATHVQGTYLYDSVCSSEAQVDTDLTVIRSITLPQTEPGVPS